MSAVPTAIRCLKCLIHCFIIRVFRAVTIYNCPIIEYSDNIFHRGEYIFLPQRTQRTQSKKLQASYVCGARRDTLPEMSYSLFHHPCVPCCYYR